MSRSIRATLVALIGGFGCAAMAQDGKSAAAPAPKPADNSATSAPTADSSKPPTLWCSTTEWNFGEIWFGDPAATDIEIRNVGGGVLKIKNVSTSCGCTVAQPSKHELASNESDRIKITYNTRKGVTVVHQEITLETDDAKTPKQKLVVSGKVRNYFDVTNSMQQSVVFGQMETQTDETITLELHNALPEKVKPVVSINPDGVPFTAKLETVEEGTSYKLLVSTKPPMKLGPVGAEITIKTGLERWPEQKFSVSGNVTPRVGIVPPQIQILRTQQHVPRRIVNISYLKEKPLRVKELRISNPIVKAQMSTREPVPQAGGRFMGRTLEMEVPPWDQFPEEGVTIEIVTDDADPQFQVLKLQVNRQPDGSRPASQPGSKAAAASKPASAPASAPAAKTP